MGGCQAASPQAQTWWQLLKGQEIPALVEESSEDVIVVCISPSGRKFRGVLVNSENRPWLPGLNSSFRRVAPGTKAPSTPSQDAAHPSSTSAGETSPSSQLSAVHHAKITLAARPGPTRFFQKKARAMRLRPRQTVCTRCKMSLNGLTSIRRPPGEGKAEPKQDAQTSPIHALLPTSPLRLWSGGLATIEDRSSSNRRVIMKPEKKYLLRARGKSLDTDESVAEKKIKLEPLDSSDPGKENGFQSLSLRRKVQGGTQQQASVVKGNRRRKQATTSVDQLVKVLKEKREHEEEQKQEVKDVSKRENNPAERIGRVKISVPKQYKVEDTSTDDEPKSEETGEDGEEEGKTDETVARRTRRAKAIREQNERINTRSSMKKTKELNKSPFSSLRSKSKEEDSFKKPLERTVPSLKIRLKGPKGHGSVVLPRKGQSPRASPKTSTMQSPRSSPRLSSEEEGSKVATPASSKETNGLTESSSNQISTVSEPSKDPLPPPPEETPSTSKKGGKGGGKAKKKGVRKTKKVKKLKLKMPVLERAASPATGDAAPEATEPVQEDESAIDYMGQLVRTGSAASLQDLSERKSKETIFPAKMRFKKPYLMSADDRLSLPDGSQGVGETAESNTLRVRFTTKAVESCDLPQGRTVKSGDIIWGKIHRFPWWPGKVISVNRKELDNGSVVSYTLQVSWFASTNISTVLPENVGPFMDDYPVRYNKKRTGRYKKAVKMALLEVKLNEDRPAISSDEGEDNDSIADISGETASTDEVWDPDKFDSAQDLAPEEAAEERPADSSDLASADAGRKEETSSPSASARPGRKWWKRGLIESAGDLSEFPTPRPNHFGVSLDDLPPPALEREDSQPPRTSSAPNIPFESAPVSPLSVATADPSWNIPDNSSVPSRPPSTPASSAQPEWTVPYPSYKSEAELKDPLHLSQPSPCPMEVSPAPPPSVPDAGATRRLERASRVDAPPVAASISSTARARDSNPSDPLLITSSPLEGLERPSNTAAVSSDVPPFTLDVDFLAASSTDDIDNPFIEPGPPSLNVEPLVQPSLDLERRSTENLPPPSLQLEVEDISDDEGPNPAPLSLPQGPLSLPQGPLLVGLQPYNPTSLLHSQQMQNLSGSSRVLGGLPLHPAGLRPDASLQHQIRAQQQQQQQQQHLFSRHRHVHPATTAGGGISSHPPPLPSHHPVPPLTQHGMSRLPPSQPPPHMGLLQQSSLQRPLLEQQQQQSRHDDSDILNCLLGGVRW